MMSIVWLLTLILVGSQAQAPPCAKVKPIQRVPSSASGIWYLVAAKRSNMMHTSDDRTLPCGGFNNGPMCSCSMIEMSSTISEPFIPEYNITSFGYNKRFWTYDSQSLSMKLAGDAGDLAIFNVGPREGDPTHVIRGLATDNHQTFMLLYICDLSDEEADLWLLTKCPAPSEETIRVVSEVLEDNMLTTQLQRVPQEGCDYPERSTTMIPGVSQSNKFRVF